MKILKGLLLLFFYQKTYALDLNHSSSLFEDEKRVKDQGGWALDYAYELEKAQKIEPDNDAEFRQKLGLEMETLEKKLSDSKEKKNDPSLLIQSLFDREENDLRSNQHKISIAIFKQKAAILRRSDNISYWAPKGLCVRFIPHPHLSGLVYILDAKNTIQFVTEMNNLVAIDQTFDLSVRPQKEVGGQKEKSIFQKPQDSAIKTEHVIYAGSFFPEEVFNASLQAPSFALESTHFLKNALPIDFGFSQKLLQLRYSLDPISGKNPLATLYSAGLATKIPLFSSKLLSFALQIHVHQIWYAHMQNMGATTFTWSGQLGEIGIENNYPTSVGPIKLILSGTYQNWFMGSGESLYLFAWQTKIGWGINWDWQ